MKTHHNDKADRRLAAETDRLVINYKKNIMRTIKEVWSGLADNQRKRILNEVVIKGGVSFSTVYMWLRGERRPMPLYQELISKAIFSTTGEKIPANELFTNE